MACSFRPVTVWAIAIPRWIPMCHHLLRATEARRLLGEPFSIHMWFGGKRGVQCIPLDGVKGYMRPSQSPLFIVFSILVSTSHWGGVKLFRIRPSKHQPYILSQIAGLFDAVYKYGRTLCR